MGLSIPFSSQVEKMFYADKHEVYSMGLNIKGQLGHGNF